MLLQLGWDRGSHPQEDEMGSWDVGRVGGGAGEGPRSEMITGILSQGNTSILLEQEGQYLIYLITN